VYNDHNFLAYTWEFTGRNASVILNRRNKDKTCKTALEERGKFNSLRRDLRSCSNNTTPSCVCWPSLSPPHTPTCSPWWNLLKQGSLQSTGSCPGLTILHHQPLFIHSVKIRKAGNLTSARTTGWHAPLQKYRVCQSEKRSAEKGRTEEREEEVMTNVHLTRTSIFAQDRLGYGQTGQWRCREKAGVRGEGRAGVGKDHAGYDPDSRMFCLLGCHWQQNFLNEPELKIPNAPSRNTGDIHWDGKRPKDKPKAELYSVFPSEFPFENNNKDAGFITAFNQSWMSPTAYTVLWSLFKGASNSSISILVYHRV